MQIIICMVSILHKFIPNATHWKKTSHVLQLLSTELDAITFNRRASCDCRLILEGFKEIWNKSAKKWLKEEITDLKLRIKENHDHQSHDGDQKKKSRTPPHLPYQARAWKRRRNRIYTGSFKKRCLALLWSTGASFLQGTNQQYESLYEAKPVCTSTV